MSGRDVRGTRRAAHVTSRVSAGCILALVACTHDAGKPATTDDVDGDGFAAARDCDDTDAARFPGAPERGDSIDRDCDGLAPPPPGTLAGAVVDGSAGYAVAQGGGTTWMGAPFAGRGVVGQLPAGQVIGEDRRGRRTVLDGQPGEAFGAALAVLADGTLLVGAPGANAVRDALGTNLWISPGAGATLVARGARWAAGADGLVHVVEGTSATDLPVAGRPSALTFLADGRVVAGFRAGPIALAVGDRTLPRAYEGDEAGLALASCDVDADGDEELVVGAPGSPDDAGLPSGAVYLLDPDALPESLAEVTPWLRGTGRFGAAIACGDAGTLHVGAPMSGDLANGARHVVRNGRLDAPAETGTPGDQLGFALSTGDDVLVVGAPGAPDATGRVGRVLR